jgi:hypothetical protein
MVPRLMIDGRPSPRLPLRRSRTGCPDARKDFGHRRTIAGPDAGWPTHRSRHWSNGNPAASQKFQGFRPSMTSNPKREIVCVRSLERKRIRNAAGLSADMISAKLLHRAKHCVNRAFDALDFRRLLSYCPSVNGLVVAATAAYRLGLRQPRLHQGRFLPARIHGD